MVALHSSGAEAVADRGSPGPGTAAPRVVFVSHTSDWVGPTNSLTLLVRLLKDRYHVRVFVPGRGDFTERLETEGIEYDTFPSLQKWDVLRLRRAIRRWGADLVYANNTHSSSRVAFFASRLAGVPFVTHVRGMAWNQGWRRMGYLRLANRVVAVSNACAASVRRFAGAERLVTVYNGIPAGKLTSGPPEARVRIRQELGLDADTLMITSVSHVMPRKGQELGLEAFARFARVQPRSRYVLVGRTDRDPDFVASLRAQVDEMGLEDRVVMTGFRRDVDDILDASDVFLHTAVADPHPRSVIEAMARGLPVVAFAVDGVAESVVHEETGLLASPGEVAGLTAGLVSMAASAEQRDRMGRAGRERIRAHFTDEATADGVAQVIDSVLLEKGRRS